MKRLSLSLILGVTLAGVGTIALASRNSSGTYSLASGNPVTSGTSISSTWANNTLGDLAQGVTDSLDRNGRGGMLASLRTPDGTVSAPAFSFSNETGTGLYRIGSSDLGVAVGGVKQCEWTGTGVSIPGSLSVTGASTFTGAATFGAAPLGAYVVQNGTGISQTGTANQLKLGWDGSYVRATVDASDLGPLAAKGYVDGLMVGGYVRGTDGAKLASSGATAITSSRTGTGAYQLTGPTFTSSAVLLVTASSSTGLITVTYQPSGGNVFIFTKSGGVATDSDFAFFLVKL